MFRSVKRYLSVVVLAGIAFLAPLRMVLAEGIPAPWGISLQSPGSPVETRISSFHDVLLWIITLITIFVLILLLYVVFRFRKSNNPVPSQVTHNAKLEVIWTLLPCLILLGIAFYSFPLLYFTDREPKIDLTVKVTGHQWYWSYEYPDEAGLSFDSHAIWSDSDIKPEEVTKALEEAKPNWLIQSEPLRMLEVDNRLVLPVGKNVRVQITTSDVEHSWFVQSMGVNRMAVPGHLNQVWLRVDHEGLYYGQCSMICGRGHGYMPIVIEGVSPEQFEAWVKSKKKSLGQSVSKHFASLP